MVKLSHKIFIFNLSFLLLIIIMHIDAYNNEALENYSKHFTSTQSAVSKNGITNHSEVSAATQKYLDLNPIYTNISKIESLLEFYVNSTGRRKRQSASFDTLLNTLNSFAADPNISDYNYCETMKDYNDNDFPFRKVILQKAQNRFDNWINITKYISATIKRTHTGKTRSEIPKEIKDYLIAVGKYYGEEPNRPADQIGHLLAHSLGGTYDTFNFAPMSARINTQTPGCHSVWYGEEEAMRKFVQADPKNKIEWELCMEHRLILNNNSIYRLRPTAFLLRHKNYNKNGNLVDNYGIPINQPKPVMKFVNQYVEDGCIYSELT